MSLNCYGATGPHTVLELWGSTSIIESGVINTITTVIIDIKNLIMDMVFIAGIIAMIFFVFIAIANIVNNPPQRGTRL